MKLVTHAELKDLLLPAMSKSMLRNPEIVMDSIANIVAGLSVDLSQYAQEVNGLFLKLPPPRIKDEQNEG